MRPSSLLSPTTVEARTTSASRVYQASISKHQLERSGRVRAASPRATCCRAGISSTSRKYPSATKHFPVEALAPRWSMNSTIKHIDPLRAAIEELATVRVSKLPKPSAKETKRSAKESAKTSEDSSAVSSKLRTPKRSVRHIRLQRREVADTVVLDAIEKRNIAVSQFARILSPMMELSTPKFWACAAELEKALNVVMDQISALRELPESESTPSKPTSESENGTNASESANADGSGTDASELVASESTNAEREVQDAEATHGLHEFIEADHGLHEFIAAATGAEATSPSAETPDFHEYGAIDDDAEAVGDGEVDEEWCGHSSIHSVRAHDFKTVDVNEALPFPSHLLEECRFPSLDSGDTSARLAAILNDKEDSVDIAMEDVERAVGQNYKSNEWEAFLTR